MKVTPMRRIQRCSRNPVPPCSFLPAPASQQTTQPIADRCSWSLSKRRHPAFSSLSPLEMQFRIFLGHAEDVTPLTPFLCPIPTKKPCPKDSSLTAVSGRYRDDCTTPTPAPIPQRLTVCHSPPRHFTVSTASLTSS